MCHSTSIVACAEFRLLVPSGLPTRADASPSLTQIGQDIPERQSVYPMRRASGSRQAAQPHFQRARSCKQYGKSLEPWYGQGWRVLSLHTRPIALFSSSERLLPVTFGSEVYRTIFVARYLSIEIPTYDSRWDCVSDFLLLLL